MVSFSAKVDPADLANLDAQIKAYTAKTRRSIKAAVSYAAILIARSMAAQTKIAPKRRKVIKNPNAQGYGVHTYHPTTGAKQFTPIMRNVKKVTRNSNGQVLFFDKTTGVFVPESHASEMDKMSIKEARKAPIVNIRNSRLCKKLWQAMAKKGNTTMSIPGAHGIGTKTEGYAGLAGHRVTMHNKLRYAEDALKNGEQSINLAIQNGTAQMKKRIEDGLMKS